MGSNNPIGSTAMTDLFFNAGNLDKALNSTLTSWIDRFGVERPTFDALSKLIVELKQNLLSDVLREHDGRFVLRDYRSFNDYRPATDGTDVTALLQQAINETPSGGTLSLIGGPFTFDKVTISKPIILTGDAALTHNGFRLKTSKFTSMLLGTQTSKNFSSSSRAFQVVAYEDVADYEDIKILYNRFEGFFYSTDFRAKGYYSTDDDPTNRVVQNTLILGCTSIAPVGKNAGHFQHTGITNAKCIACTTHNGQNATSYNFINGNGFIIVQGCYDENNSYGSLEIENNKVSYAAVDACAFGKQLWIDDTANVSVSDCVVKDRILITAEHNDTDNINISGGVADRISITKFGELAIGSKHKSININGITLTGGGTGSHDIFIDDSAERVVVQNVNLNGESGSAIAAVRHATANHLFRNNQSRVNRQIVISGSGGKVIEYGNDNTTLNGTSDSRHLGNLLRVDPNYLDLPGKYVYSSKYSGSIAAGDNGVISLPIPDAGTQTFRGVSLWVMIRDPNSNNTSCFKVTGMYRVVGNTVALDFSGKYGTYGIDFNSVTPSNAVSDKVSININLNNSGTKTLQVTVVAEVSSRLGLDE